MTEAALVGGTDGLVLKPEIGQRLLEGLPGVAEQTVLAVVSEIPGYTGSLSSDMRNNIERAVEQALAGFIRLAEKAGGAEPLQPAIDDAYQLGRGEARNGRTMDDLLAAYRVGAREAWREFSSVMVEEGMSAGVVAGFAELVFAYIVELSAASVAGHSDEIDTTGRVREIYLERLGKQLLEGAELDALNEAAERAGWAPPETLTAVLVPEKGARRVLAKLDARTLRLSGDIAGIGEIAILLAPDAGGGRRPQLISSLHGRGVVVGPARPWVEVAVSLDRAMRIRDLYGDQSNQTIDTDQHLAALLVQSDPAALDDLRRRALEPLSDLRPGTAEKLEMTLRSWLLHQGRREEVAAALFVHPQTVRYRMAQIRELFGDRLQDPEAVHDLVIALGSHRAALSDPG